MKEQKKEKSSCLQQQIKLECFISSLIGSLNLEFSNVFHRPLSQELFHKIKETLQTVKRSFNHCSLYLGYSGFLLHFCFLVVKGTLTYRLFDLFEEKGSFF